MGEHVEMAAICGNQRLFRQKKVYVPHTPCTAGERGARCRPGAGGREEWRRGRPPLRVFSEGGQAWQKAASQVEEEQNADAGRGDQQRCLHRQKGEEKPDGDEEKNVHTASVQKVPGMRPCGPCRFRKAYTECCAVFGKTAFFFAASAGRKRLYGAGAWKRAA